MQITREELNPCTIKLTVACDASEVQEGFNRAYKQIAKQVRIPGFRPGHAPRSVLEPYIVKEQLYETAADIIVRNTFKKSLEQEAGTCEYEAKIPLPAKVTLGEYKGLPLDAAPVEVTADEVEKQIEEFRKRRQSRELITDRGVTTGDVVIVNVKESAEKGALGRSFMVIAGQAFEQLDQLIAGMSVEEMKNAELSFPEGFQEKDWAGTTKNVTVAVSSITAVRLPELDDEFAKSLQVENIDELRSRVEVLLKDAKIQVQKEVNSDKLLNTLFERSTVYVSDNMWEGLAERRMQETADEQHKLGKTMEEYATQTGMTLDALAEAWYAQAKTHVERALLIREIFVKEKMQLTNNELNSELGHMANELGMEPKALLDILKANNSIEELQFRAISRRVSGLLEEHAVVAEAVVDAKPAKAAKAKPAKAETAEVVAAEETPAEPKPKKAPAKKKAEAE